MIGEKSKSELENHPPAVVSNAIDPCSRLKMYDIEELDEPELLLRVQNLFSSDPTLIIETINFFDIYLHFYKIPLTVSLEIQPFFINSLSIEDIPNEIIEPCLRIISSISSSFSDKFDYFSFFSNLWKFLPSSYAFDAISSLITANHAAAVTISKHPFLPLLHELFQSDDRIMQSGALGIFNSIAFHSELAKLLHETFNQVLDFHITAEPSFKIQCFETFINLISNHYWCDILINSSDLPMLFQIDETDSYDGQLLTALRLLNALILNSDANPEELILNSETIPLIMNGFSNEIQIIQNESVYIIENTIKRLKYIPEFICSCEIVELLYEKNNNILNNGDFNFFQFTIHTLCMICERANDEQLQFFIDNNFVSVLCEFIDSIDQPFINDAFLAIIRIIVTSISLNTDQVINEISSHEEFLEFLSKNQLESADIILKIISKFEFQNED